MRWVVSSKVSSLIEDKHRHRRSKLGHLTKEEIIERLKDGFAEVESALHAAEDRLLFSRKDRKWSAAENTEHLVLSVRPLALAFRLPKFVLRFFGKPNRPVRTYDELVARYQSKLGAGGKATPAFVPKITTTGKQALLLRYQKTNQKLIASLGSWKDGDFDRLLLPHPLLGKLIVREMLYFTIYHTQHHLKAIKKAL